MSYNCFKTFGRKTLTISGPSIDVHQSLAATGKGTILRLGKCVSCWADLGWRVHTEETVQTPGDTVSQADGTELIAVNTSG